MYSTVRFAVGTGCNVSRHADHARALILEALQTGVRLLRSLVVPVFAIDLDHRPDSIANDDEIDLTAAVLAA